MVFADIPGRTVNMVGRPTAKALIRVVDGLEPGTKYTFTIAAVTGSGTGPSSSVKATAPAA